MAAPVASWLSEGAGILKQWPITRTLQSCPLPTPHPPDVPGTREQAQEVLRELVGHPAAEFHDGQFEAIEALVDGGRRALVVQRTGWGKSAVYFVSSLLLRRRGAGPTLIVSPLLALMRDQVAAAARAGVRAVAINSANQLDWDTVREQLAADEVDVLLVSPERLTNPSFRENQLPELIRRTGLLVIDEAHCISDWGHDFRPDYRRIADLITQLPDTVPVLATTATANSRVVHDIEEQLGAGVLTIRGALGRESLRLGVLSLPDSRDRLGWLLTHLKDLPGSGIIYTLTVSAAEDTARLLAEAGHEVLAYTGRTDPADRERAEQLLKDNQVKALVATSALGMGFDKPDLGFVVHLGAPSSPVAYYQQVGRAGRGAANADVLLLPGSEDRDIWQYFATASMPSEEKAGAVLTALAEAGTAVSTVALEARVDLRRTPLELLLKVLAVDGAVERVGGGWRSTGQPWTYDAERYSRIAEARVDEQDSMVIYQDTAGCRMEYITSVLDDETARACGRCDNCAGTWFPADIAASATEAAGADAEPRRCAAGTAAAVAQRHGPAGRAREGQDQAGRKRRQRPRAGAAHGPGLGRRPARSLRRRRPRPHRGPRHAAGLRPGAARVGRRRHPNPRLERGRPARPRSSASRPAASPPWWTRWPAASRRSAGSRTWGSCSSTTADRPAAAAATAPTGLPASGTAWWWDRSWRQPWPGSRARA